MTAKQNNGWIPVKTRNCMPKDEKFLAIWKGAICLADYDRELNQFWISISPSNDSGFVLVAHEREPKFYYWMPLPEKPKE